MIPARTCRSVVFPAPLGPVRAIELPLHTSMSTPSIAVTAPSRVVRPRPTKTGLSNVIVRSFRSRGPADGSTRGPPSRHLPRASGRRGTQPPRGPSRPRIRETCSCRPLCENDRLPASAAETNPASSLWTIPLRQAPDRLAVVDSPSPAGSEREPGPLRSLDWSRALDAIVYAGIVVGMASFVAIDLITSVGRHTPWLSAAIAFVMVWLVFATFRNPLTGVVVASGLASLVTIGYYGTLGILGVNLSPLGFSEVAAMSILSSEVVRTEQPRRAAFGLLVAVMGTVAVAVRTPAPVPLLAVFWLTLTLAVVAGLSRRWAQRNREMTEDATRRAERLAIARELHDSVAHH